MEKKMENEVETGGNIGIKEFKISYYIGKPCYLLYIPIMVT